MNITYNWLKEFIAFDWPVRELANKLTFSGVEVEAVEEIGGGPSTSLGDRDWRLELEVTPNRPDCLSLLGLAREIAALSGLKINKPDCTVTETGGDVSAHAKVRVEDPQGCPRYVARVITGVKVAESPDWIKTKLAGIGLRPVNNVADITNLVLYELGHPLHAFDLDKLTDRTIVVRRAKQGEILTTLDGTERKLDSDFIVIADGKKAVALAGIMGGSETEISSPTRNVLLESAYFEPALIRRGSHALGLKTDASYRFERGADPNGLEKAVDRCAKLISEIAGGTVVRGRIDVSAQQYQETSLTLRPERANKLLGITIPAKKMAQILNNLELGARLENGVITAAIPTFRRDLEREADLIEEVGRIFGYDSLPAETIAAWTVPGISRPKDQLAARIAGAMTALGYCEHIGLTLIDPARLARLLTFPPGRLVELANPLSSDLAVLRPLLLPGLLDAAARNLNNGIADVRLFEAGLVFAWEGGEAPRQSWQLAGLACGGALGLQWDQKNREYDFYDLKGAVQSLFAALRLEAVISCGDQEHEVFLHPGRRAGISLGDARIGCLGELAPQAMKAFDLKSRCYYFQIGLEPVAAALAGHNLQFAGLPKFPAVKRDLALTAGPEVTCGRLEDVIRSAGGSDLEAVRLFDLYQGKQIGAGSKSMAFSLVFRAADRTLTDDEVNQACARITAALKQKAGAEIRTA